MKLFELTYWYFEDKNSELYSHPDKTREQFEEDIKMLLAKYGEEYLEKTKEEGCIAGQMDWLFFASSKLQELGYSRVFPNEVMFSGGNIIDERDTDWKEIVGERLSNKALKLNDM